MNLSSTQKYMIRGFQITVDVGYERSLGIYGETFWEGVADGSYETVTFNYIEQIQKDGFEYFLDIGAATGCMSLYAASMDLKVVAVEPQELVYSVLMKNIELNKAISGKISVEYALVSASKDVLASRKSFTPGAQGPLASISLSSKTVMLRELLEKFPKDANVGVKIDIEGAEFPLFSDKSTIEYLVDRKPSIFIALHPGFKKSLPGNANFISKLLWRFQASQDVAKFYAKLSKVCKISIASSYAPVSFFGLMFALWRDEKDYILQF
jgi:FkbM family methyltransferase